MEKCMQLDCKFLESLWAFLRTMNLTTTAHDQVLKGNTERRNEMRIARLLHFVVETQWGWDIYLQLWHISSDTLCYKTYAFSPGSLFISPWFYEFWVSNATTDWRNSSYLYACNTRTIDTQRQCHKKMKKDGTGAGPFQIWLQQTKPQWTTVSYVKGFCTSIIQPSQSFASWEMANKIVQDVEKSTDSSRS